MGLDANFNYKVMASEEIQDFRKFYELQDLMCDIWCKQNPDKEPDDFNCQELEITEDILKQIKELAKTVKDPFDKSKLWTAIGGIEMHLSEGTKVYYWNWY